VAVSARLEPLDEALAYFAAFRELGFSADEIFLEHDLPRVGLGLRTQGKSVRFLCGAFKGTADELFAAWKVKAEWWNGEASTHVERSAIWRRSAAYRNATATVMELVLHGIQLPCTLPAGGDA
jgi:hypothetical protein